METGELLERFKEMFGGASFACREKPSLMGNLSLVRRVHVLVAQPMRIGRQGRAAGQKLCRLRPTADVPASESEFHALPCGECIQRMKERVRERAYELARGISDPEERKREFRRIEEDFPWRSGT